MSIRSAGAWVVARSLADPWVAGPDHLRPGLPRQRAGRFEFDGGRWIGRACGRQAHGFGLDRILPRIPVRVRQAILDSARRQRRDEARQQSHQPRDRDPLLTDRARGGSVDWPRPVEGRRRRSRPGAGSFRSSDTSRPRADSPSDQFTLLMARSHENTVSIQMLEIPSNRKAARDLDAQKRVRQIAASASHSAAPNCRDRQCRRPCLNVTHHDPQQRAIASSIACRHFSFGGGQMHGATLCGSRDSMSPGEHGLAVAS